MNLELLQYHFYTIFFDYCPLLVQHMTKPIAMIIYQNTNSDQYYVSLKFRRKNMYTSIQPNSIHFGDLTGRHHVISQ